MNFLKSIYQTLAIKLVLGFYGLFKPKSAYKLAENRMAARGLQLREGAPVKVFAIFAVNNWETALLEPLQKMGETFHFAWEDGKLFFNEKSEWQVFHNRVNKDLISAFNDFYDSSANMIVFLYSSDFVVSEESLRLMQRSNTLLISFCWDDLLNYKGSVKSQPVGVDNISRYADINLTFSPETIPRYHYHNSPCFFWESLPLPVQHHELSELTVENEFYVLFIGSRYGWRGEFIEGIRNAGIKVKCFGSGWENGSLSEEEMWKKIQEAPLTLGFSNVGYTKTITTIKGRDFEVPLRGGLFLTQDSKGLRKYYQSGKEILVYNSFEECIQQIGYVRENKVKADIIRRNGYLRAQAVATWDSRFLFLNKLIGDLTPHG